MGALSAFDITTPNNPNKRVSTTYQNALLRELETLIATAASGGSGSALWGGITGTLSDQADLNTALSGKLVIARNLSDLADASTARDNLGVTIGTDVQAYNANLTTYAGIAPSTNVQSLLGAADYAAIRAALSLVVGTDVQAYAAALANIAGLTLSQGDILYRDGSGLTRLPAGASGQFLKTLGTSGNPAWASVGDTVKRVVQITDNYISADTFQFATSLVSMATGLLRFAPFSRACIIKALAIEVTSALAGTTSRMGLYTSDPATGLPAALIEECTSQSTATIGIKDHPFASNITLDGNLYWIAHSVSGTITCREQTAVSGEPSRILGATSLNTASPFTRFSATFTHGALPATTAALTMTPNNSTYAGVVKLA